ncbi:1-acylglycerol-3-phosphate O-acyltransferase ABHD5-like [Brevipalpus obovatus]|uniref:1-acylglycerol-3-phosphate O-acyltransferase ABHD5-like n=1 Tax=Brevipalpus obovatus TaxID=246614 RepID=UPI003D9EFCF1
MIKVSQFLPVFFNKMTVKLSEWVNWSQTSPEILESIEGKLLSYLRSPYKGYFVDIGSGWGLDKNKIWTLEMGPLNDTETEDIANDIGLPLVMIHGFGAGAGIWIQNLDELARNNRKVFALDVPGFGRSSRPYFEYSDEVEWQLTECIERWRVSMGINHKFILLGHSFGAYLALSYALQYPEKVANLILVDPWGMPCQQQAQQNKSTTSFTPLWIRGLSYFVSFFKPFFVLRAAGPWGLSLIKKFRQDLRRKFEPILGSEADLILTYLYHCNVQSNPSGEAAFKALSLPRGWAKYPMVYRIGELHEDISLTFIYGARSWIDREPAIQIKYILGDSRVSLHIVKGAGHHVYADKAKEFNEIVNSACNFVDFWIRRRRNST